MTFREQLEKLRACHEALIWVGNSSLEESWETCNNTEWMLWILNKTDLDLTDPICDMAERVLHLVPEYSQAVCKRAISAARRRAKKDELDAAFAAATAVSVAAYDAARVDASYSARYAADSSYNWGYYSTARAAASAAATTILTFDTYRVAFFAASAHAASANNTDNDYFEERKNQCNILRKYFTVDQVRAAFNKLVELNQN
jgi:hypothetical protein